MKNQTLRNAVLVLGLAMVPCVLTSCNKDKDAQPSDKTVIEDNTKFPDDSKTPSIDGNVAQSAESQKDYLDKIGTAFMDEFKAENMTEVIDLINYINDKNSEKGSISKSSDSDEWDWSAVEDWADNCMEALVTTSLGNAKEKDYGYKYSYQGYNVEGTDIVFEWYNSFGSDGGQYYDVISGDYESLTEDQISKLRQIEINYNVVYYNDLNKTSRLYTAAQYKGDFELVGNKWEYTKSDGLQFKFTDDQGKTCVLKLETSGNTTTVYGGCSKDIDGDTRKRESKVTWNADKTVATLDVTTTCNGEKEESLIEVPEVVTVTLTRDGKDILQVITKTDLEVASQMEYNINKDSYAASTTVKILDYAFTAQKFNYSSKANSGEAIFSISHGNSKLLEMKGSATAKFDMDEDDVYDVEFQSGEGSIAIDILGKVQLKGSLTDADKFFDALEEAEDNENNADKCKQAIEKANKYIDLSLYFCNGSAKQAKVVLEPIEEEEWDGETYWTYNWAIQFEDGTRFAFDDYVGENDFMGIRDLFDAMEEEYENKLDLD